MIKREFVLVISFRKNKETKWISVQRNFKKFQEVLKKPPFLCQKCGDRKYLWRIDKNLWNPLQDFWQYSIEIWKKEKWGKL